MAPGKESLLRRSFNDGTGVRIKWNAERVKAKNGGQRERDGKTKRWGRGERRDLSEDVESGTSQAESGRPNLSKALTDNI